MQEFLSLGPSVSSVGSVPGQKFGAGISLPPRKSQLSVKGVREFDATIAVDIPAQERLLCRSFDGQGCLSQRYRCRSQASHHGSHPKASSDQSFPGIG